MIIKSGSLWAQTVYIEGWRNPDHIYCVTDIADTLTGESPSGKPFYFNGESYLTAPALVRLSDGVAVFKPWLAGLGPHEIRYGDIGNHNVSVTVNIVEAPVVTISPFSAVCSDSPPFQLFNSDSSNVSPETGFFSGPGVDANDYFHPAVAGPGIHSITYTVNEGGCTVSVATTITVFSLPVVGINAFPVVCEGSPSFALTQGYPSGGTWSGPGVTVNSFNPLITGAGTFTLTYSFTNGSCSNSASRDIVVSPRPVASIAGLDMQYCDDDPPFAITGIPAGTTGIFTGTGITDNGDGTAIFDPAFAGLGAHVVTYVYTTAAGCSDTAVRDVQVGTDVSISGLENDYCVDEGNVTITGYPAGGTFSSTGSGFTDNGNSTANFNTSLAGAGIYSISYSYLDVYGCLNTITIPVRVHALPVPVILDLDDSYCPGAAPVTIRGNYSPGGTFSGSAIIDNSNGTAVFSPALLVPGGPYQVEYTYTNPLSGCTASVLRNVIISPPVTTTLSGTASACSGVAVPLTISLSGTSPYNIQYTDGYGFYNLNNIAGSVHTFDVFPADTTTYTLVSASDANGCTTAGNGSATVSIIPSTTINSHPASVIACAGDNISFSASASGSNILYQWQKDGADIPGAVNSVYSIINSGLSDGGVYRCLITGDCGPSIASNEATLFFYSPVNIVSSPSDAYECEGGDVSFSVVASGSNLTYKWYRDGIPINDDGHFSGSQSAVLQIYNLVPSDAGSYHVVVTGSCGSLPATAAQLEVDRTGVITSQPTDADICEGGNANFIVTALGDNLTYQWQKDNLDITGAILPTLSLTNISALDEGFYRCVITSGCGTVTVSDPARLTHLKNIFILNNPVSTTECEGDNAIFSVTADGSGLTYQWQKDGADLSDNIHISGSLTPTLAISGVTGTDTGIYSCILQGSCGSVVTTAAELTVNPDLIFLEQPVSVAVCPGDNTFFEVEAQGALLMYQWKKDGADIPGANSPVLVINNAGVSDIASYTCTVVNNCGQEVTSNPAELSMNLPVTIIDQPADMEVCSNSAAAFAVDASGTGLSYRWEFNGLPISDSPAISGTNTNTILIDRASEAEEGVYNCLVTGSCNAVRTIPASLVINDTILFLSQPEGDTICEGANASFSVSAYGAVNYQWQKDETDLPGQNGSTLLLNAVTVNDSGVYRCMVYSHCDTLASDGAFLSVKINPAISVHPQSSSVCEGGQAHLDAMATGDDLTWQWLRNGVVLNNGNGINGAHTSSLVIDPSDQSHNGIYSAIAGSVCGSVTTHDAVVTVMPVSVILTQPLPSTVCAGGSTGFSVQADNAGSFQWQKDNVDIPGATGSIYNINNVTTFDAGIYRCRISGPCGDIFSDGVSLIVSNSPVITSQPSGLAVCENGDIVLSAVADGEGLTYQWIFNGMQISDGPDISGSNTPGLFITDAGTSDAGIYQLRVSGSCGSELSNPAVVTIEENIIIDTQPQSEIICEEQPATLFVQASGTNLLYQWQKDGIDIPGADQPLFAIASGSASDEGIYRCIISNSCGTVYSEAANLEFVSSIALTEYPQPVTDVCAGASTIISLSALGTDLFYSWLYNGIPVTDDGNVQGSSTGSLSIGSVDVTHAGIYTAVVSNSCFSVNAGSSQLRISDLPVITQQPVSQNSCTGENVSFTVSATGTSLSYQWQKGITDIPGENSSLLTLGAVSASDEGIYRCVVFSDCDTVYSVSASLDIYDPVSISEQPASIQELCEGSVAHFNVTVTGDVLSYRWQKDGTDILDNVRISGSSTPNLTVWDLTESDEGVYSCIIEGACNAVMTIMSELNTLKLPHIFAQPADFSLIQGGNATFVVSASGSIVTYQWYYNNHALSDGSGISGAQTNMLTVLNAGYADEGHYHVEVNGTCGTATSNTAELSILSSSAIIAQPSGGIKCEGETVVLVIETAGSGNTFQWKKNGQVITDNGHYEGTLLNVLTINSVDVNDAAAYSCTVNGTENSAAAIIYVNRKTQITGSPENASVCEGDSYILNVIATGDSLKYRWYKDGVPMIDGPGITGSLTSALMITLVSAADAGNYSCEVTGACGTAFSDPASVDVSANTAIIMHPSGAGICEGQTINLAISAEGTNLSYNWYKNGTLLIDDGRISGSATGVLTLFSATPDDQGAYTCIVTGMCNTVESQIAYVSVTPKVYITGQPKDISVCTGNTGTFIVIADNPSYVYQWQKDGVDLSDSPGITGSQTNMLRLDDVQLTSGGLYRVMVTSACDIAYSLPASLTISSPPVITGNPVSDTICAGQSLTLSVEAEGDGIEYHWYRDGFMLPEGGNYSGTSTADLQIISAGTENEGVYYCEVTNDCSQATSEGATISVFGNAGIVASPSDTTICEGTDLSLIVFAGGDMLSYRWQKDNVDLTDGSGVSGSGTATLSLQDVTPATAGSYRCVVSGFCGEEISTPSTIIVKQKIEITAQPLSDSICEGTDKLLTISASGSGLIYRWKKDGQMLSDNETISGSATGSLLIKSATPAASGVYTCEIFNGCSWQNSDGAVITVVAKGLITIHPLPVSRCLSDAATFTISAQGTGITFQWQRDGVNLSDGPGISGANTPVLSFSDLQLSDMGVIRCVITDICGNVLYSDGAALTVYEPVSIISIPAGDTICEGESVTLTVSVNGDSPIYRWFRNGSEITEGQGFSGFSGPSLLIEQITTQQAGYYYLEVSGYCGTEISNAIPVLVNEPVSISLHPANITKCEGESAIFSIELTGDSLKYQWTKDGIPLTDDGRIDGAESSMLFMSGLIPGDAGSYQCLVTGACGTTNSHPGILTINTFPEAAGAITGETAVCEDAEGVTYIVADIPGAETYSWSLPPGINIISGEGTRQISVSFASGEHGGPVSVSGVNGCGSGAASPVLSVTANPVPLVYAGENTGVCSDEVVLSGYLQDSQSHGLWEVLSGPAMIDDPSLPDATATNLRMGTNIFRWTVTRNGCSLSDTVTVTNNNVQVEAGTDTTLCNHIYYMDAVMPTEGFGEWSIIRGAGYNIDRENPGTIVTGLARGLNTFRWTVNNSGCVSYDTVNITNNMPSDADAGYDETTSFSYTNLNANDPATGTGEWSLLNGSAVIADNYSNNTMVSALGEGPNVFRWTIFNNGCYSSDTVIIYHIQADSTDAGPNRILCSTSVRLEAENPYPGYGEWSVRRGSATFEDAGLYNTMAYNLGSGENVLVWTTYLNGISSDSVVILNKLPTTANAGVNFSVCEDTAVLNANLPYIGEGQWSVVSGAGIFSDATSNTPIVRDISRGANVFKWTVINETCTSSSYVTVVNNKPTDAYAGIDILTCEDSVVLSPNTPTFGTGEWSVFSGAARFNGNTAIDLGIDDNVLIYSIINAGCVSHDTIVVTSHKPTTANLGDDISICQDFIQITGNTPHTGTGTWTLQSGSAVISDASSPVTAFSSLGNGENIFRWTISYEECSSYDDIIISNDYVEAYAGPDKVMCSDRTVLEANDAGKSTGTWTVIGGTSAFLSNPHDPNAVVENLAPGTTILRWTISKNACSSFDEVTLVNNLPTRAFAGQDVYLCTDEVQLRANPVTTGTGSWSVLSGYAEISDINDPSAMAASLGNGPNILRWTVENEGCVLTDEVVIRNNLPGNVYAGIDQQLCADSTSMYADIPTIGIASWSIIQGSADIEAPDQHNSKITNISNGVNIFKWNVTATGCSASDTVTIINDLPTVSKAGADFSVCADNGMLNANNPEFGTGEWSVVTGSGIFGNSQLPVTSVSELAPGLSIFRWTITNNNCISEDDIYVRNESPTIAYAGDDQQVCGNTAVIYANDPSVGEGYWEIISGGGQIADPLSYNTTVSMLNFGQNTLRWNTATGACTSFDDIVITNNLSDVYAGEDIIVYEPEALLKGNNPASGFAQWILVAGAGEPQSPSSYTTTVSGLGAGLNTFEWTIDNNGCIARDQVVVNYKVMPSAGFTVNAAEGCPGLEVSFTNTTVNGTTYIWEMGDGTVSTAVNPVHHYENEGTYLVKLTAAGPDNKTVTSDTTITIFEPPLADFITAPDSIFVQSPMRCYDNSSNAMVYSWDFGDSYESAEKNPMHSYSETGDYLIKLVVTSGQNCSDSISRIIRVIKDGTLIFPNAFTPDPAGPGGGSYSNYDMDNNVFHPYHENITEYHMEIYSRWGTRLFETDDIYIGWDGYYNGRLLDRDVYVWRVSGKYRSGRDFSITGSVLLIR